MSDEEVVDYYLDVLFTGKSLVKLHHVLNKNLDFLGPFAQYSTAEDYVKALLADPPVDFSFKIIERFKLDNTVCVHYLFTKPGVKTKMIQIFEIQNSEIKKIRLFFNPGDF